MSPEFPILEPDLQIAFYFRLRDARALVLRDALRETIGRLDVSEIDRQLAGLVSPEALRSVAASGVRGEVVFPVPAVLRANPRLVGYYRLLLGFSRKRCYGQGPFGRFQTLEDGDVLSEKQEEKLFGDLPALCASWIASAERLVTAVPTLTADDVRDVQLLTLGAQLRGSENNAIGNAATLEVFGIIRDALAAHVGEETKRTLILDGQPGEVWEVAFAADPDVSVVCRRADGDRRVLCIEIKGGGDVSNVHNRIGEAEKSHQKALRDGFEECWTIVRASVDWDQAHLESPSTREFFGLDRLLVPGREERVRFGRLLRSRMGLGA